MTRRVWIERIGDQLYVRQADPGAPMTLEDVIWVADELQAYVRGLAMERVYQGRGGAGAVTPPG